MNSDNSKAWIAEADKILQRPHERGGGASATHFAMSLLANLYGPESPQMRQFREGCAALSNTANASYADQSLWFHATGVIKNTKEQLQAGLIGSVRVAVAGEILAELIGLAKETIRDHTDQAKNVAAVLIASAYEGLMRRMGEESSRVGQIGIAQSYLRFRNDSLHADWNKVDRSQVESCLAFSESLLTKHFF